MLPVPVFWNEKGLWEYGIISGVKPLNIKCIHFVFLVANLS